MKRSEEMNLNVKEIEAKIGEIESELAVLREQKNPFEVQIARLENIMKPIEEQINPLAQKLEELKTVLKEAQNREFIMGLKVGDVLTVRHKLYDKDKYEVIDDEVKQRQLNAGLVVHEITITEVRNKNDISCIMFCAKGGSKKFYGYTKMHRPYKYDSEHARLYWARDHTK